MKTEIKLFLGVFTLFFIFGVLLLRNQEIRHSEQLKQACNREQAQDNKIECLQIELGSFKVEYFDKHKSNLVKQFGTQTEWTDKSDKEDVK